MQWSTSRKVSFQHFELSTTNEINKLTTELTEDTLEITRKGATN